MRSKGKMVDSLILDTDLTPIISNKIYTVIKVTNPFSEVQLAVPFLISKVIFTIIQIRERHNCS